MDYFSSRCGGRTLPLRMQVFLTCSLMSAMHFLMQILFFFVMSVLKFYLNLEFSNFSLTNNSLFLLGGFVKNVAKVKLSNFRSWTRRSQHLFKVVLENCFRVYPADPDHLPRGHILLIFVCVEELLWIKFSYPCLQKSILCVHGNQESSHYLKFFLCVPPV